ncbi:hypothetical protein DEO72_LG6g1930 [Vigna unguiculata]|uniref:Uncharacterized protein n=1 Tax=Vigna unguiculata TaxID=3917 RepID=A0A4D6M957_VIGUN|nr:hypothetical protein DEO72_LG6g1930 [Vigna unguiculata]
MNHSLLLQKSDLRLVQDHFLKLSLPSLRVVRLRCPLLKEFLLVVTAKASACGNSRVIWYFCLGEWLSPKRKHQKTHPCSCAKPRLGELRSLKRETLSSKRTSSA